MDAHLIIDKLWISNGETSQIPSFFKDNKITAVLNVTKDIPCKFKNKLDYGRVYVDDSLKQVDYDIMTKCLPYCVEFINKNRNIDGKNVLVHCHEGAQRSAVSVLAYLLKYHPDISPTIKKGANFIHSKRPIAWHNNNAINFDQSIYKYYNSYIKPQKILKKSTK